MNSWRILVAPLCWGLGHATRCSTIIKELLRHNIEVYIASDGDALKLLQEEFPSCIHLNLPAYDIHYKSQNMIWNLAKQSIKILTTIRNERIKITNIIETYKINLLITDNRFGVYSPKIPSIFITHQLHIRIPNRFLMSIVQYFNYKIIKKYTACWVPDLNSKDINLSGDLSHPNKPLKNVQYIGALSRLNILKENDLKEKIAKLPFQKNFYKKGNMVLLLLSGPEPQRSYFETELIKQATLIKDKFFVLVRGIVQGKENTWKEISNNIYSCNYLQSDMLSAIIQVADYLVSRSGYSTVMDYFHLQRKNIIFIPTPGQTEQEYLAQNLAEKNIVVAQNQNHINLNIALKISETTIGFNDINHDKFQFSTHILPFLKINS